jgi:hypothetical protein
MKKLLTLLSRKISNLCQLLCCTMFSHELSGVLWRGTTPRVHPSVLRLLSFRFTERLLGAPAPTCLVGSMEDGSQNAREICSQNAAKPFVTSSETNDRTALHGRAAPGWEKNHQPPKLNSGWTQTPIGLQHWSLASCSQDGRAIYRVRQPGMKDHKIYCVFSIGSLYSSANQWGGKRCGGPSGSPLHVLWDLNAPNVSRSMYSVASRTIGVFDRSRNILSCCSPNNLKTEWFSNWCEDGMRSVSQVRW